MASSSGGKRLFNPQKWVPLRPQDIKPENMAQPRGKLPPLDPAVTQKINVPVEPMSVVSGPASPSQPTGRRSFVAAHPANFLERDSHLASHEHKVAPFGFRDESKAPKQRFRKNSMTGLAAEPEESGTDRMHGHTAEVPPTSHEVHSQHPGQDTSTAAGSHVSLAPSVSPTASASQTLLPNTAQPAAVTATETAITIAAISQMPSLASTSTLAGTNATSPEGSSQVANRFSRATMASLNRRVLTQHKAHGTAKNPPVDLRAELHQAFTPETMDAAEHTRRLSMITNAVTRAKERVFLVEKDNQQKKPIFGRFSCWKRWLYERRIKQAAKGPKKKRVWCVLWMESLKAIEGAFGSAVMLTFAFLRWVFLLNVVLAAIWMGLVIIPFWVKPPPTFSWKDFWKPGFNAVVQGDALEKTWIFFGGYFYSQSDQPGRYRVDWAYPIAIAIMFLVSLVAILARIASRIMGSGDASVSYKSSVYPVATVVFTSWDFHITSHESATKLRRGVRNELREMLADIAYQERRKIGITMRDRFGYFALFVLWPLSVSASLVAVVFLVKYADRINAKIGTGFGQPLLLAALNVLGPIVTSLVVSMENWRPAISHQVLLVKLFLLRVLNLSTLIVRLFMMLNLARRKREGTSPYADCSDSTTSCGDGFICCTGVQVGAWKLCTAAEYHKCLPACVENTVGLQLIRLIISTALINNALELIIGFGTLWIFKSKRHISVENMTLDVLYLEALVWIATCFAPATAPLAVLVNLLTFYCMKISLMYTCEPLEKRYSASKTSNITYGLLCFALVLCSIPVSMLLVQRTTSFCGPIRGDSSMYAHLSGYIQDAPSAIWVILEWVGNVGVLWGVLLILVICIILLRAKLIRSRQHLKMSQRELNLQKREVVERSHLIKSQSITLLSGAKS